jgi:predicted lipoprotein with Yx(FWY)xxD motif
MFPLNRIAKVWFIALCIAVLLFLAGCSGAVSASAGPLVSSAENLSLGLILVDSRGMTLYMYSADAPDQSNCSASCLQVWTPLVAEGAPEAGLGVDAALLGAAPLSNGKNVVTYNKMPLYLWTGDLKPGDLDGQNFQGSWFAVAPDGKPVVMPLP